MRELKLYTILLLVAMVSCTQLSRDQVDALDTYEDFEISAYVGERKIFYRFPAPNDIINHIKTEELIFHRHFLNPTQNTDRYIDSRLQLFNLGVYSADFAYITVFETLTEAAEYFAAIEKLAYSTGLTSVFTQEMRTRVKENQDDIDSLSTIARDSYNDMVQYLTSNGNEKQLAIISAGGYVEVIYLAIQQTEDIEADYDLLRKLYDQRYGLENLISFAADYTDDPWMEDLTNDLNLILDGFNLIERQVIEDSRVVKGEDNRLRFSGGRVKISLSAPSYQELKSRVQRVRGKYTNPFGDN